MTRYSVCTGLAFAAIACTYVCAADSAPTAAKRPWGQMPDGTTVNRFDLKVGTMEVGVIEYGATLVSIRVPDKDGKIDDVLLGFDTLEGYFSRNFGGVTGRFANRIGGAKFTLDGVEYSVTPNAGKNHIHGGRKGFDKVLWTGEPFATEKEAGVRLTYLSKDGEEGYPGNLNVAVTYAASMTRENNTLEIHYEATTDKPTVINLTNHAYFNLAGAGNGSVHDHLALIDAARYAAADEALIPTGEIRSVEGTPLDFRNATAIGLRINALTQTRGYDHNYVFDKPIGKAGKVALFVDLSTGRRMDVLTTEPGMQFYTANHLRDLKGRDGKVYNQHGAFCVETQHYPDSPNKPHFPSVVLRPGEKFESRTQFMFRAIEKNPATKLKSTLDPPNTPRSD